MKKLFTLALAALSVTAVAQSSIQLKWIDANNAVVANKSVIYGVNSVLNDNVKVNFDIKNTSSSTQKYIAKRYDVVLNSGASAYFCFAGTCYGEATMVSPNVLTLTPGQSASEVAGSYNILTADLDEFGTSIQPSYIRYSFVNTADNADSVQVTIAYNVANPVGIKENASLVSSFEIFPNPASQTASLRINAPKAFESAVTLFNSLGQAVYQQPVSLTEGKNNIALKVDHLPAGVYFASIKTGTTSVSKKLVIN